jgi:hypothetical protein
VGDSIAIVARDDRRHLCFSKSGAQPILRADDNRRVVSCRRDLRFQGEIRRCSLLADDGAEQGIGDELTHFIKGCLRSDTPLKSKPRDILKQVIAVLLKTVGCPGKADSGGNPCCHAITVAVAGRGSHCGWCFIGRNRRSQALCQPAPFCELLWGSASGKRQRAKSSHAWRLSRLMRIEASMLKGALEGIQLKKPSHLLLIIAAMTRCL